MNINPRIENVGTGVGEVYKQIDSSETNQLRTIKAGAGIAVTNNTSDVTIAADLSGTEGIKIPVLNDVFTDSAAKPFWTNTEMFTSGDWQFGAANDRLEGIAENNTSDWYRQGIEGDADHSFKYDLNSSSCGIWFTGNSIDVKAKRVDASGAFTFEATGKTTVTLTVAITDPFWIRLVRETDDFRMYYKQNDGDAWILVGTHSDLNLGNDMLAKQDSGNGSYIYRAVLYDNSFNGSPTKAKFVKVIPLTDAATIAIDASLGNLFTVTLGDNRTLGAPTNAKPGQMIVIRVKQDGTGSRTLAYNAIYRFSTDIPSPTLTTTASKTDYLGFIYNEADTKWDCIGKVFGF